MNYTTETLSNEPEKKQPIGRRVKVAAIVMTALLDMLRFTA